MNVITLMVDPENGHYIAIGLENHRLIGFSRLSRLEAVGNLVEKSPGIQINRVVHIESDDYERPQS